MLQEQATLPLLIPRFVLGLVFVVAGTAKLWDRHSFAFGVREYRILPRRAALIFAHLVPIVELVLGIALLSGVLLRAAGVLAIFLLGSFLVAVVVNLLRGRRVKCHCFSATNGERIGWSAVVRLICLIILACIVAFVARPGLLLSWPAWDALIPAGLVSVGIIQLALLIGVAPDTFAALRVKAPRGLSSRGGRIRLRDASPNLRLRTPMLPMVPDAINQHSGGSNE